MKIAAEEGNRRENKRVSVDTRLNRIGVAVVRAHGHTHPHIHSLTRARTHSRKQASKQARSQRTRRNGADIRDMAPILEKYALDRELRRFLCPRAIYIL